MDLQNSIHFILQGKGGVGKSFVSVLLWHWLTSKLPGEVFAYDTDQVNTTFAHYKGIGAEHIPVMNESLTVDTKCFDSLVEKLLSHDGAAVIDNGSNTFAPLLAYMVENGIVDFLQESGKKVYIHTIVGGGDNLIDTAAGFKSIAEGIPEAPLVLWLNEHFGELKSPDDKHFTDMAVYRENRDRVTGTVLLAARNHQTFGSDIARMNKLRMTIDEVLASPEFALMEKKRIRDVARDIYAQLDEVTF